jgi:hypothetical protein
MIEDLLHIAEELATRDLGRPKQASLRRSVSTAYYALFHAIADRCARTLVTWGADWETYTLAYRALDHVAAKKVFTQESGGGRFGPQVAVVASIFVRLQDARIIADYLPKPFPYNRLQVLEFVAQSRFASKIVGDVAKLPTEEFRPLASQLIFKKR